MPLGKDLVKGYLEDFTYQDSWQIGLRKAYDKYRKLFADDERALRMLNQKLLEIIEYEFEDKVEELGSERFALGYYCKEFPELQPQYNRLRKIAIECLRDNQLAKEIGL